MYPAEAVIHPRCPMIFEVVDEEHVPEDPSIVATASELHVGVPNGSIANIGGNLPIDKDGHHVGGPDSDETMKHSP